MKFLNNLHKTAHFHLTGTLHKTYPGFTILCEDPFVGYYDLEISDDDISHIIECADDWIDWLSESGHTYVYPDIMHTRLDHMEDYTNTKIISGRSFVNENRAAGGVTFVGPFIHKRNDAVRINLQKQICDLIRQPVENCEELTAGVYVVGKSFDAHYDSINYYTHPTLGYCAPGSGGARTCTATLYLNDDFQGGETEFPKLGIKVKPKKGRLLLWHNVGHNAMVPHPGSTHAGTVITQGKKYILTFWIRVNKICESTMQDFFKQNKNCLQEKLAEYAENMPSCTQTVTFED
jgi:hypothetical protein